MNLNQKQKSSTFDSLLEGSSEGGTLVDESWLITYSDVVSLLLVFFVVFFAISKIDLGFFEQFKASVAGSLANSEKPIRTPLADIKRTLDSLLLEERKAKIVNVDLEFEGVTLNFTSAALYTLGSADLKASTKVILDKISKAVKEIDYYPFTVNVEGHTDDIPINSVRFPSNWELSVSRATVIVRDMIEEGLEPKRLFASGYADTKPLVPNKDELGKGIPKNRERNRRILIIIN